MSYGLHQGFGRSTVCRCKKVFQLCFVLLTKQKKLTEKVDVARVFGYKTTLDVMDSRCSNSAAVLAVLMGIGACALFAPESHAGDRIEFSAPAIPLSVPRPEVEIKQPARMIGSGAVNDGIMDSVGVAAPSGYILVKPKKKDKDDWSLDSRLDYDPDRRDFDDVYNDRLDSSRDSTTNSNNLNAKQGMNPNAPGTLLQQKNESNLDDNQNDFRFGAWSGTDRDNARFNAWSGADKNNSRFGSRYGYDRNDSSYDSRTGFDRGRSKYGTQNESDKDYARSKDRLGGEGSSERLTGGLSNDRLPSGFSNDRLDSSFASGKDDSLLTRVFGHDASGMARFDPAQSTLSASDPKAFGGGLFGDSMNDPALGQDSTQRPPSAPGYAGFTPLDDGQSRQFGDPSGDGQASFRAWEQPAVGFTSPDMPARGFSNPDQANNFRVVAPSRPAILAMPTRPGDPH